MSNHCEIWLVRHGETEWSKSGQHTSYTDLPLTAEGERRAADLKTFLANQPFKAVFASPMQRAQTTAKLAGFAPETLEDLREWNYGKYEGLTTPQIQQTDPGWSIWTGKVPEGEQGPDVEARADRAIAKALEAGGSVAFFAHGHILRVLGARWLGMRAEAGKYYALSTATVSVLGYEHSQRVLKVWNQATA